MPNLSGTQATQELRKRGFSGKIISMTGDPSGCLDREEFEKAGLDLCVNKDSRGVQLIVCELQQIRASDDTGVSLRRRVANGVGFMLPHSHSDCSGSSSLPRLPGTAGQELL
jgi:hypothetical protein